MAERVFSLLLSYQKSNGPQTCEPILRFLANLTEHLNIPPQEVEELLKKSLSEVARQPVGDSPRVTLAPVNPKANLSEEP